MGQLDMVMGIVALAGVGILVANQFGKFVEAGSTAETIILAAAGGSAAYLGARMVF